MEQKKYAASVLASIRTDAFTQHNVHECFVVEAASRDEAEGKAAAVGRKRFPTADGWFNHCVGVCDLDTVWSVETVKASRRPGRQGEQP